MRKAFSPQMRFDCQPVPDVRLNVNCRDELVPILRGLQHIYSQPSVRDQILSLVAKDVNGLSRNDRGRTGLSYWEITVLGAVRLGCNLDYDKLQDLAEQHRALRQIMGVGDWSDQLDNRFNWRRIHDNVCLLRPETIEAMSHHIVALGHCVVPQAVKKVRADSFVVETNIHYPTESSLIVDGLRKTIEMCVALSKTFGITGWRQHQHLLKRVKKTARQISRIGARKGAKYKQRLLEQYRVLLRRANQILERAKELCQQFEKNYVLDFAAVSEIAGIRVYIERTEHVCGTARRRVLEGGAVPNEEKLFSMFEPHTQLYKRGKSGQPIQFGRLVLVYEDAAGFITHHHLMPRDAQDQDVLIEQTRKLQTRLDNQIEEGSFDRGFHSPENQQQLAEIIDHPCLPKPGPKQTTAQQAQASVKFHQARQRHPGVESAIGALQCGNGLARCRDGTEEGFERYVALGILGRNLHVLGKLLIASEHESAPAAHTKRAAA
jgi:hypothetical protein